MVEPDGLVMRSGGVQRGFNAPTPSFLIGGGSPPSETDMDRVMGRRRILRRCTAILALAGAALTLGGCVDDGYGYDGGVYGGGGYYGSGYYDGGLYGGGWPSYGWYDGFYYPGSGIYVYDRIGHRRRWDGPHGSWHGRPPGGGGGWHGGGWRGGRGDGQGHGRPPGDWHHGAGSGSDRGPGSWHGRPDGGRGQGRGAVGTALGAAVSGSQPSPSAGAPARPQSRFGGAGRSRGGFGGRFGGGGRRGGDGGRPH
jgi:hypothetical protein